MIITRMRIRSDAEMTQGEHNLKNTNTRISREKSERLQRNETQSIEKISNDIIKVNCIARGA